MFIDDKNQQFVDNAKSPISNRLEIAANLHARTGLPLLPRTLYSQVLHLYVTGSQWLGTYGSRAIIGALMIWFLVGLITATIHLTGIGCFYALLVIGIAKFALENGGNDFFDQSRIKLNYPRRIWESIDALIEHKTTTNGRIVTAQTEGDLTSIHYQFSIEGHDDLIDGNFRTSVHKSFLAGDEIVILYLDEQIHTPL